MTFDDPRVLVKINSVFVTTEVASKQYKEPHGKKVLYAYWGTTKPSIAYIPFAGPR